MGRYAKSGSTDSKNDAFGVRTWELDDIFLTAVVVVGVLITLLARGGVGVIPGDTGALAHAAERVLDGELPHRDFDDPYTGGLSVLHALSFAAWGEHVSSMRRVWMGAAALFCGLLFIAARRVLNRPAAVGLVVAAFLWSIPNYPSPMPTWYNLFFAVAGAWALDRYIASDRLRWVAVAGVCGGLSIIVKVVGLYFFAAAGLFLVYRAQLAAAENPSPPARSFIVRWAASLPIFVGVASVALAVLRLIWTNPHIPEFITFVVPSIILAGFLAHRERLLLRVDPVARLRRVVRDTAVLIAGAAIPLFLYLCPYILFGSLDDWWQGVFVKPRLRLGNFNMGRAIDPDMFCVALIAMLLPAGAVAIGLRTRFSLVPVFCMAALGFYCLTQGRERHIYTLVWEMLRIVPAVAAGIGAYVLNRTPSGPEERRRSERTFLWLALAALFSLVQYPLAHGIYFLYAAPVLFMASAYLLAQAEVTASVPSAAGAIRWTSVLLLASLTLFGGTWVYAANPTLYGVRYVPCEWNARLVTDRARIRYDPATARIYNRLIEEVRRHSPKDGCILALPDCAEIYYFTGRRNPTRTFYDAFDGDYGSADRDRRILSLLEQHDINVVVLREWGSVSPLAVSDDLFSELQRLFPYRRRIGDSTKTYFSVLWREPGPANEIAATESKNPS